MKFGEDVRLLDHQREWITTIKYPKEDVNEQSNNRSNVFDPLMKNFIVWNLFLSLIIVVD